jgi:hypothetical protein
VDFFANFLPKGNSFIAVNGGIVRENSPLNCYWNERSDNRSNPSFGKFGFPVDSCLIARTIVVIESAGNIRAKNPIFNG